MWNTTCPAALPVNWMVEMPSAPGAYDPSSRVSKWWLVLLILALAYERWASREKAALQEQEDALEWDGEGW